MTTDDVDAPAPQVDHFTVWRHGGRGRDRWRVVATIPANRNTVKVGGLWGKPNDVARGIYDQRVATMRQGGVALLAPKGDTIECLAKQWSPRLRTRW